MSGNKEVNEISNSLKIKLLSQGSYGCIYKPGINCQGKKENSKFITKIQQNQDNTEREVLIGEKVKKIKNYKNYFGPIVKSCDIAIGNIENDEIKKCDIIGDSKQKYLINKIKYVGKNTLMDYFYHIFKLKHKLFLRTYLNCFSQLLLSVSILNSHNILHMDLKENNILIDDNTENPIIIDFGLSYDITDLQLSNFRELFFVYGYDYPPWCFDISVISFLVNDLGDDWENQYITKDILTKLCENFIEKNPLFILKEDENYLFKPTEIEEFKTRLFNYTLSNFVEKKAKDVVLALYSYNKTWDFYGICVIFYFSFCILHLDDLNSLYPKLTHSYRGFFGDCFEYFR